MNQQRGFFDEQDRLEALSKQGDPLEQLNAIINWEIFRTQLKKCFKKEPKGPGGRPPFDYVLMLKYQILDRLSFQRFLGQGLNSNVPDEKTIWLFREVLTRRGMIEKLFDSFNAELEKQGLITNHGSIIDASFVEVPRQRNNRDENATIKEGKTPEEWLDDPAKLRQKDTDARWTKKNDDTFYGYKDHVKVDTDSKLIKTYEVTDASVHDSQVVEQLLDESDAGTELHADSAYRSSGIEQTLKERRVISRVHEKAYRNQPLTETQIRSNRTKSRIRARVEHVFGYITNSMKGFHIRSIGILRARSIIGLINLAYNIIRSVQLQRA
jgi:IS5 family transposase